MYCTIVITTARICFLTVTSQLYCKLVKAGHGVWESGSEASRAYQFLILSFTGWRIYSHAVKWKTFEGKNFRKFCSFVTISFLHKIWGHGICWHCKSKQFMKVFSAKIVFFTNSQKFFSLKSFSAIRYAMPILYTQDRCVTWWRRLVTRTITHWTVFCIWTAVCKHSPAACNGRENIHQEVVPFVHFRRN